MKIWWLIKNLSLRQLWKLSVISLQNWKMLRPTWRATQASVSLAEKYYGTWHQKNTAANAFRHAVWNYLVAERCLKVNDNMAEVLSWTQEITDLHEELFKNEALARAMDLHNNKVGRKIFSDNPAKPKEDIVALLRELTKTSMVISKIEELRDIDEDQLVHIEMMSDL